MAKPICLVKVDIRYQKLDIIHEMNYILREKMPDYHVFAIPNYITDEPIDQLEIQVFYEKDFTPIKFEELKKFIEDSLKSK